MSLVRFNTTFVRVCKLIVTIGPGYKETPQLFTVVEDLLRAND